MKRLKKILKWSAWTLTALDSNRPSIAGRADAIASERRPATHEVSQVGRNSQKKGRNP